MTTQFHHLNRIELADHLRSVRIAALLAFVTGATLGAFCGSLAMNVFDTSPLEIVSLGTLLYVGVVAGLITSNRR
jgi:uncharacterized membrane protein YfcA